VFGSFKNSQHPKKTEFCFGFWRFAYYFCEAHKLRNRVSFFLAFISIPMRQFLKKINPFKRTFSESEREKIQFLQKNTLFENLSEEEIALFLPYLHLREYQQEEVIFFRNDPSQALYLIKSGSVRLVLDVQEKFEELVVLKTYDHMGENSLLESSSRLYSAISNEAGTEVYLIPQINLQEILISNLILKSKLHEALLNNWNRQTHALFKIYRESFAFFELGKAYFSDHF
jgi:hypothetical protein